MSNLRFSHIVWRLISVTLLVVALLSLLGVLGVTKAGEAIFFTFALLLGNFSALGPFILLCLALLTWFVPKLFLAEIDDEEELEDEIEESFDIRTVSRRSVNESSAGGRTLNERRLQEKRWREGSVSERRSKRPDSSQTTERYAPGNRVEQQSGGRYQKDRLDEILTSKGVPLPPTKLVPLKGFNEYFSSDEWVETLDAPQNGDMSELGRNFSTYFGEGEKPLVKFPLKLNSLEGMKGYFQDVDQEIYRESKTQEKSDSRPSEQEPTLWKPNEKNTSPKLVFSHSSWEQETNLRSHDEILSQTNNLYNTSLSAREEKNHLDSSRDVVPAESGSVTGISLKTELNEEFEAEDESLALAEIEGFPSVGEAMVQAETETAATMTEAGAEVVASTAATAATAVTATTSETVMMTKATMPVLPIPTPSPVKTVRDGRERIQWKLPSFELLDPKPLTAPVVDGDTSQQLEGVLNDFGVKAKVIRVVRGPVITRYELAPAPGVKISKIVNLSDDIALALAARDVRIEAPIPGKSAIGIEVPNKAPRAVLFREVLETSTFQHSSSKLKISFGKDISDQPVIGDLTRMPHLLVAGATGSGKSVCITALINSILFNATPDEVKFLMVDPKMVELNLYNGIPHLLAPVVTDPKKASAALKWIVKEMENRYELFAAAGVRDVERYNQLKKEQDGCTKPALPLITVIIDELADLMLVAAGEVEEAICRLAQMARAAGIHLVIATQRPSVDVITGLIKANIPSRISFAVTSQIDSRTILDATGAEKLLGRGDMLYSPQGQNKPVRVQGCFVNDDEVMRIIRHWKEQGSPEYLDPDRLFSESNGKGEEAGGGADDELFIDAGRLLIQTRMASTSFLQRRMKLGYSRAARLIDMLEEQGVIGPYEGSKPRQVLMTEEEFSERFG